MNSRQTWFRTVVAVLGVALMLGAVRFLSNPVHLLESRDNWEIVYRNWENEVEEFICKPLQIVTSSGETIVVGLGDHLYSKARALPSAQLLLNGPDSVDEFLLEKLKSNPHENCFLPCMVAERLHITYPQPSIERLEYLESQERVQFVLDRALTTAY